MEITPEGKRALIAAVRRVAFTGLIILGAWLVLLILRGAIPADVIDLMYANGLMVSHNTAEWDWSSSLVMGESVSELVGERIGYTIQLIAIGAGFALVTAALLLILGVAITRMTEQPAWLAKTRQVLRMILVSYRVSAPVFYGATLLFVFPLIWWNWSPSLESDGIAWWPAFFISLLPAWLLVQTGHGVIINWPEKTIGSYRLLVRDVGIKLVVTILRLTGAMIAISLLIEQIFSVPGIGRLLVESLSTRDYPVVFGIAWVCVLIVVSAKLAADLIEIAYNHFYRQPATTKPVEKQTAPQRSIPRTWLFVSLTLVGVFALVAIITPLIAPYGYADGLGVTGADRLEPISGEYWMGADQLGRDVFSRVLYGIRLDMQVGVMIAGIIALVAVGWAFLAAYMRKMNSWAGDTLEDLVLLPRDILCAFPWLVLMLLLMTNVGPGVVQIALVCSLLLLPRTVGMMREAYSSPLDGHRWQHSILWSIPVILLFIVAGGILYVSSASYLGFGIPEPYAELGGMLNQGRRYYFQAQHLAIWPGVFLGLLPLVWMMVGETLLERLGFRSKAVWSKVVE